MWRWISGESSASRISLLGARRRAEHVEHLGVGERHLQEAVGVDVAGERAIGGATPTTIAAIGSAPLRSSATASASERSGSRRGRSAARGASSASRALELGDRRDVR